MLEIIFFIVMAIFGIGWIRADVLLNRYRDENELLEEENDSLYSKIAVLMKENRDLNGKLIINTANEHYNEGKKN